MKDVSDVFDIVLLIVILTVMLPFMFRAVNELNDPCSFGFIDSDDKSMKAVNGGIEANPYQTDTYSAAEIVLRFLVLDRPNTETELYVLPDGTTIEVTNEYRNMKSIVLASLISSLNKNIRYSVTYNTELDAWEIIPEGG